MLLDDLLDLRLNLGGDVALRDLLEQGTLGGGEVSTELTLPARDLVDGDRVKLGEAELARVRVGAGKAEETYKTVDTCVDDGDLDLHGEGLVLALLCRIGQNMHPMSITRYILRSSVRRAPRESRKRVDASRSEPNWAKAATSRYWARYSLSEPANFFMILLKIDASVSFSYSTVICYSRLGGGTDTRHGETNVDGGANTTEEELSLQEDLTVGDGDDLETNRFQ